MAQDIEELRREIQKMHNQLKTSTYYELLDVSPHLDDTSIKQQVAINFRTLAKKWHVDRYHSLDIGADREKIQEIFQALNTANQILSDSKRRADYNAELNGDNTDISAIINAESAFRRGQSMLEQGSFRGAHVQFESAFNLNPNDNEYRAHYLYTEYLLISKNDEGKPLERSRAQKIYDELSDLNAKLPDKDWIRAFLATVALGLGREAEAESLFRDALLINPKNHSAQRQLRILEMRKSRAKKGFFSGFLDKLKGSK